MKTKSKTDVELNRVIVYDAVNFTGAGHAQASAQVPTGVSPTSHTGLRIKFVQWRFGFLYTALDADTTNLFYGLSEVDTGPQDYGYDPDSKGLITYNQIIRTDPGTAATSGEDVSIRSEIFWEKFTDQPGQGILVQPSALYIWTGCENGNLGSTLDVWATIWYLYEEMSDATYREYLGRQRMLGTT